MAGLKKAYEVAKPEDMCWTKKKEYDDESCMPTWWWSASPQKGVSPRDADAHVLHAHVQCQRCREDSSADAPFTVHVACAGMVYKTATTATIGTGGTTCAVAVGGGRKPQGCFALAPANDARFGPNEHDVWHAVARPPI